MDYTLGKAQELIKRVTLYNVYTVNEHTEEMLV